MKRMIINLCVAGLTGLGIVSAQSEGFIGQELENGSINYADRTISATGIGFIPEGMINAGQARRSALRVAKLDALRNLVEIVNGIVVTSETTMRDAMLDDVIKSKVEGVVRGAYQVGDPKYLSDTSVEVTYEVKMSGISEIVTPVANVTEPTGYIATETPATESPAPATTTQDLNYTGVILDARGLGLRPAMAPQVLNRSGEVIYGPGDYSREYAVVNGVAGYAKSLESAQADPRVKGNPLVVKGAGVSGSNQTDVVVASGVGRKIMTADNRTGVLRDCRVIILLD